MSRTYKDRHWKLRFPDHAIDEYERVPYTAVVNREYNYSTGRYVECAPYEIERSFSVEKPGVFTKKKRKDYSSEYQWVGETPGWWVRTLVNRPLRRKGRMWEREVQKADISASGYSWITICNYEYTWYSLTDENFVKLELLDVETPRVARGETSVPYYW